MRSVYPPESGTENAGKPFGGPAPGETRGMYSKALAGGLIGRVPHQMFHVPRKTFLCRVGKMREAGGHFRNTADGECRDGTAAGERFQKR